MEKTNKNQKSEQSGITLIALVITIIVLLILAGVSIATLTGENGILTKASNSKKETEEVKAREQIELAVISSYDQNGKLHCQKFKEEIEKIGGKIVSENEDTIVVELDRYEATIDIKTGEILKFERGKGIEPVIEVQQTLSENKVIITVKVTNEVGEVKEIKITNLNKGTELAGNVNGKTGTFETTLNGNYKIEVKATTEGVEKTTIQTIEVNQIEFLAKDVLITNPNAEGVANKSAYVTYNGLNCRVLYNDNTHGIQIITADSVENITLGYGDTAVEASDFTYDGTATVNENFKKAAASYNNVVDNLNKRAKTYMDTKGIATDARCLGSVPTLNSNSKFQGDASGMFSGSYDYLTTYKWNNKFKNANTNYKEDVKQLNDLGLNVSSGKVVLASRYVDSTSSYTDFCMNDVNSKGSMDANYLCEVNSSNSPRSRAPSYGFRPVFLLPSNVVISKGEGSSVDPYVIE